jgi:hypothetical protein
MTPGEETGAINAANSWEKTKRFLRGNDEGAALFSIEDDEEGTTP